MSDGPATGGAHGTLLAHFSTANDEFGRRVGAVPDDGWEASTPCTEWDVRTLVNHVVYELLWAPPLLGGSTIAEVGDRFEGDVLGADPEAAWRAAADSADEAARRDDALDRDVHLSFGDTSGAEYLWELTADLTVHAWDLARGSGQDDALPRALVEAVLGRFEPQAAMLAESGLFGSPVEVPADADPQTRMLGLVGRRR